MHLAIVTPYPPIIPGIGQYGYRVSEALSRSDAFERITVLTSQGANVRGLEQRPSVTVEQVWQYDGLDTGPRIGVRLRALAPDMVWYNLGASVFGQSGLANVSGLVSPILSRLLKIPSVATMHEAVEEADFEALGLRNGPLTFVGAKLVTALMLQADVTCVTLACHADRLRAQHPGQRLMHIPHGAFDSPRLLPESKELELLHFGSQAPFKGLDLLLRVFVDLYTERPRIRLTVAGAEHPRFPGYVESLRQEFGDHPAIKWEGFVPTSELQDLFGRAAIVVLPYRATTGSSSVLYRAVTWGRPVVASDLDEMQAVAREGGFEVAFFRSGDTDGLAEVLSRLLDDRDRRMDQVRRNQKAVGGARLEKTCQGYLRAFNLALNAHTEEASVVPSTSLIEEAA